MGIRKEKFSNEKMDRLKKHLELYHKQGNPIEYEIVLDQFKTVRRTSDLTYFDNYKSFIDGENKEMMIRLFSGKSNYCDKLIYYWEE